MRRGSLRFLWMVLLAVPVLAGFRGGWAVITVEELPDHASVGEPLALEFTVRQHGVQPMRDLTPVVEATAAGKTARVRATAGSRSGVYTATVVPPAAGDLEIHIASSFGNSDVTLQPIHTHPAGRKSLPLTDFERGRRLFVAKGCVTCHLHAEFKGRTLAEVGPELTDRRYTAEFLSKWLAEPPKTPTRGTFAMPDLDLDAREIASLTAFINAERGRHALK